MSARLRVNGGSGRGFSHTKFSLICSPLLYSIFLKCTLFKITCGLWHADDVPKSSGGKFRKWPSMDQSGNNLTRDANCKESGGWPNRTVLSSIFSVSLSPTPNVIPSTSGIRTMNGAGVFRGGFSLYVCYDRSIERVHRCITSQSNCQSPVHRYRFHDNCK